MRQFDCLLFTNHYVIICFAIIPKGGVAMLRSFGTSRIFRIQSSGAVRLCHALVRLRGYQFV